MRNSIVKVVALTSMALPAIAQEPAGAEGALIEAYSAEHQAWEEDLQRWQTDHDEALAALREAIDRFEEESMLEKHQSKIDDHGEMLRQTGLTEVAGQHARARSEHEELRETHHHLMDVISLVQQAMDNSRETG